MNNDNEKKNIEKCIQDIGSFLKMGENDVPKDELEVSLEKGEVLYCKKCHAVALGPQDLRIRSNCKANENDEHDFAILVELHESIAYCCSKCCGYWWQAELSPEEIQEEPCEKSEDGLHHIKELVCLSGFQKVKPVFPKVVAISIKEANINLSPIEFHLGAMKTNI